MIDLPMRMWTKKPMQINVAKPGDLRPKPREKTL
jgi:hypothetical protein